MADSTVPLPPLKVSIEPLNLAPVVKQGGGKKKEKKRKRQESNQAAVVNGEPPRKYMAPPTGPRKRPDVHHPLPPHPTRTPSSSISGSGPSRDLSRSPLTPVSPIATIRLVQPARQLQRAISNPSHFQPHHISHSSPAILSNSRNQATKLPTLPTPQLALTQLPPIKPAQSAAWQKDQIIRGLRQKLVKREADLARMTKRAALAEGQLRQKSSLPGQCSASGNQGVQVSGAERSVIQGLEIMLGGLREEKDALEISMSTMKEEGRGQSTRLVEAEIKCRALAQQVKTAVDRGKKWVTRSEEFEVQLGEKKKDTDVQRKRAEEAEDQLEMLSADTALSGTPLRQNLLSAKSGLAQERLLTQDLRGKLFKSGVEISGKEKTIIMRDASIRALTTIAERREIDLAESNARIVTLDKECEGQLVELRALLEAVTKFSTDVDAMGREKAIRQQLCENHYARIVQLVANLVVSHDRAEWYKAQYHKKEGEAQWWQDEAERIRKVADAPTKRESRREVRFDRHNAQRIFTIPSHPLLLPTRPFPVPDQPQELAYWQDLITPVQDRSCQPPSSSGALRSVPKPSFAEKLEIARRAAATLAGGWAIKEEEVEEGEVEDIDMLPSE